MIPVEKADEPVDGNAQVVELLEGWLERAKLGYLNCVALVACESPTLAMSDHAGVNTSHFAAYVALDQLKARIAMPTLPGAPHIPAEIEKHIPANRLIYDILNEPTQFDFLPWIITNEMTRIREGMPAPLQIKFIKGRTDVSASRKDLANIAAWMERVIVPIVGMVGATIVDDVDFVGRRPSCYGFVEMSKASRAGEPVPKLKPLPSAVEAVDHMLQGMRDPVVITLRESFHWPHRNSNLGEWMSFACKLREEGEFVIFVRDTQKSQEPLDGFATCPNASLNLDFRVALYERAKCNLFVDNGPWTLALFGTRPVLAFVNADPMTGYIPNTPQWWKQNHGVARGEQFPWCAPNQRIVWEPDTYETMCREWKSLVSSQ